ncbi:MAG: hypothetical protein IJL74_01235 [Bacilli bacterium]|nr:hypothetical protein [Bacilli bacterium]
MLNKLLKYDLKYMIKNMSIFYILGIFFAVFTRIFFSMEQTVMVTIIGQITLGCMFSMIASILINVMMRSWVRFRDSIYKDEAYLTHTLPVTKNDIYNSKFFQTLIFFVISFVIVLIALFITYYTPERWLMLKNYVNAITTGLSFNTTLFVVSMLSVMFLEIFNAIQCGFLGIILGYKQNSNKIAYSVLFGFSAYIIAQSIVLGLTYMVGLFDGNIMDLFNNTAVLNSDGLKLLTGLAIIFYIVIIFAMNILCKKKLNDGVNIE